MKTINELINERSATTNKESNKLVQRLRKLDLENYFGLDDWEVEFVAIKDVLGKDIKSEIIKYEEDYKKNVDDTIEVGNYILLNTYSSMKEHYKENYKINNNSIYYIASVYKDGLKPGTSYYLAVSKEILEGKTKYDNAIKTIKEHLEPIKESIISIGHKDYFSQELYDLLMDLYKKKKISDPKYWF